MGEVQRSAPSLKTEYLYPGVKAITNQFTDKLTNNWMGSLFGENDDFGQAMGNIFSNGITSVSDTFTKNLVKGDSLTAGLGKNVGTTLGGVGAGIAGNLLGKGITSLGGNTALSRGLGLGVSTAAGSLGGDVLSNVINGNNAFKGLSTANLAGLGMSIVGSGLQAALGPSKEYGGRYGHITQGMDTAYDLINAGASFVPGVGTVISGAMTLNKGLSNLFGSTDGMTRTDAILGSAFMPAPVKWVNMWGSSKTGTFNNLSWLNDEKANSFMGNAFGNLNDRFKRAREEAGKTYGTFSQGAKREALDNLDFANRAWALIMNMADENELAKIRSLYMTSINNQRYALNIQGGFSPVSFGRMGMKLLNNSIPHEVGLRLLSGAALINSGLQILSAQGGTKVPKKLVPFEIIGEGQLDPTLAYRNFTINGKPAKLLSANYNTNIGKVQYEDGSEEEIRLAPNFWLNPKSSDSKKIPMLDTFREGITNQAANEKADEFANRTSLTPERFTENIKTTLKNRLYRTISPSAANYNILDGISTFLKGKDYDYTIDASDDLTRRAPTIDAIWANYLQIPIKDRRYHAVLEKSKYKPSKGNNNFTYYKLPLVDFEKAELIDRTRDLSLNSNKVNSIFSVYGLGDNTIGRGYDNKGEYVSYFDTFDVNPFNGKYNGVNIPLLNKLDDIGLGQPLKIYDRIYLDDYYGVPKEYRGGVYLPEVTVE